MGVLSEYFVSRSTNLHSSQGRAGFDPSDYSIWRFMVFAPYQCIIETSCLHTSAVTCSVLQSILAS